MNLTELEDEIRATLTEAGQQAHVIDDLATKAARPVRRRRTWLAAGLAAASIAAVAVVITITAPDKTGPTIAATPTPTPTRAIAIPTSSWKPGDGALQAARSGVLRATPEGCPYLSSPDPRATDRTVLIWPAGYTARYAGNGKIEILAPNGSVVVREGDELFVGGGSIRVSPNQPCILAAKDVFVIMEDLTR